jgi:hypothetical protein
MNSHSQALQSFAKKLSALLMLRGAVRWATIWFFVWGVFVLASRFAHWLDFNFLLAGLLGAIPLAMIAAIRENRRRAAFSKIRAAYDGLNQCGGILMAEEVAEMSAWNANLPEAKSPALRWRGGRSLGVFGLSALFVAVALLLPDRVTTLAATKPLEIGKLVGELNAEVQTLQQEKILEPKKAEDTKKQLAQLEKQSSATDPNKTWEALDHIKESNSDLARQAAEEGLDKMTSLSGAQTLATALKQASDNGMSEDTATRAAQELAGMLKAAKLEDGLLKGNLPPELLSNLNGLDKEQLQKLLGAIQFNKNHLGNTISNLANLRMIDAKYLSQCTNAGHCTNPNALAAFLSSCTNLGNCSLASLCYGRGGPGGGGGTGPMTWQDESSDQGAKFQEHALPPSTQFADSQFVGVSRSAPQLSDDKTVAEHGALASAQGSGGSANARVVLPEHRQAVRRFFKRDEN